MKTFFNGFRIPHLQLMFWLFSTLLIFLGQFFIFSTIVKADTELPFRDISRDAVSSDIRLRPSSMTGAFFYEQSIVAPPGRGVLTPDLKLTYTNQGGEDINLYGHGWSDNIPYIERINKTGTNTLYDEFNFHSSFDGEIRSLDGSTTTELHGARFEGGDFRKYEFVDHTHWKVTDKTGTVYTFGTTTAARLDNPSDSTEIYRWMLEEVRDPNGNYISYDYYKDSGQIYPLTITYTGHDTTDGIFTINFEREARSATATSSKAAFPIVAKERISQINTKINGVWVRKYDLDYTTGDNGNRQLLDTITESGQDEGGNVTTLPTTNFDYQTVTKGWGTSGYGPAEDALDSNLNDMGVRFGDV